MTRVPPPQKGERLLLFLWQETKLNLLNKTDLQKEEKFGLKKPNLFVGRNVK